MPQTREHLAIVELLGVHHGVVAVTFADTVDDELLELAVEDARDALQDTPLQGAPVIPFSSVTGAGESALVEALDRLPTRSRPLDAPFRMSVDRVFSLHGHGTIVTGTVRQGRLSEGDELEIVPERTPGTGRTRVRGIQVHGKAVGSTRAGLRTALNLPVPRQAVGRGCELAAPGTVEATRVIDVQVQIPAQAPRIEDGHETRFLVGTAEGIATTRVLDHDELPPPDHLGPEPWTGFLELQLSEPVPCLPGDRFILRRASPVQTLGGGTVLDPWPRPVRHRDRRHLSQVLARLARGDRAVFLLRAGGGGLTEEQARRRGCHPQQPGVVKLGDRVLHTDVVEDHARAVEEVLARFHRKQPLVAGARRKELVEGRLEALTDRALGALLERMTRAGRLQVDQGRHRLASFEIRLDEDQQAARDRILEAARQAGLAALDPDALAAQAGHPQGEDLVRLLADQGDLVRVGSFLVSAAVLESEVEGIRRWLREAGSFTPQDLKARTGLTRKHLIPLLEWLDAQRITRRAGDRRWPGRS